MMASYILTVTFKSLSGQEEALKKFLESIIDSALKHPGCIQHDLHQSIEDPSVFMFYECWESEAAHEEHIVCPEVKAWRAKLESFLDEPYEAFVWTKANK